MPSKKQEFSYPGRTTDQLLQLAYGAFLKLGWTPKYAGPDAMIGYTPRSWNKYDDEVLIEAKDGGIVVTSSLVHNESFDLMGKNKKHIRDFITAFDKINSSEPNPAWIEEIEKLRQQTVDTVTKEVKEAEEINKVMNIAGANLYATYAIIAINVIVFILMAIDGAGIFAPNALTHIKWGSNYTPLTLSGDWWRLITSTFIHFGIIHLAMNAYALYMAGVFLEPMLGKIKYLVAYLSTGIFAGIISLWWHKDGVNSAGASGAIFGMYGVFLALLFTNLIPKQMRSSLLQSIGIFVVFNIVYGMRSGIDNAAHIGGLVSGLIIGLIFYPILKNNNPKNATGIALIAIIAVTALSTWLYLKNPGNEINQEVRQQALNEIEDGDYPDSEVYLSKLKVFSELETEALAPFNESPALEDSVLSKKLNSISSEKWDRASAILQKAATYNVSVKQKKKAEMLIEYVMARKEQIKAIDQLLKDPSPENNQKFNEINKKVTDKLQQLKDLN
jgi:rhomboid protease GluP